MVDPEKDIIVTGGGGSGPISAEDEILNRTPNLYSLVSSHDAGGKRGGGHSREIRTLLGVLPPGDATHRLAVHLRQPDIRDLFTLRYSLKKGNKLNGHRPSNDFLAGATYHTGSLSEGIKLLEEAFKAHYLGRVIPITDDNIHLRAILENGAHINGEGEIDTREECEPPIIDIEFIGHPIRARAKAIQVRLNPEVVEVIQQGAIYVDLAGSEFTSRKPLRRIISPAIQESNIRTIWFSNAVTNFGETDGWTASRFLQSASEDFGDRLLFAFVNMPSHEIPPRYIDEKSFQVPADLDSCRPFAENIYGAPLTELFTSRNGHGDRDVVRHNGDIVAPLTLGIAKGRRVEDIFDELGCSYVKL